MATRRLQVEIVGDAASLSKAFRGASDEAKGFGSTLGGLAKTAGLVVGGAALGGIALTLKTGISEWSQSAKVTAQTAAVLKSTGGAANVTMKQITDLSGALLRKTGIDDEAIQSGENLLLTFRGIRDEAGKGNDIFTQSTKIMTDMSVSLGQDMKSSALQLGKALNDPIKGVTALQRVGVSFTASQKESIKAMVDSGNTMGAQKLILGELNKEFGGSAEAVGKTLPGQLSILREEFNNVAGDIVGKLVPTFQSIVTWTTANWPRISATMTTAFNVIDVSVSRVVATLKEVIAFSEKYKNVIIPVAAVIGGMTAAIVAWTAVTRTVTAVTKLATIAQAAMNVVMEANPIGLIIVAAAGLAAGLTVLYERSTTFRKIVNAAFGAVKAIVLPIIHDLTAAFDGVSATLGGIASTAATAASAIEKVASVASKVSGVAGGIVSHIPGFAEGVDNFRGGMAIVGEKGPELLNLPGGSSVIPMRGVGSTPIAASPVLPARGGASNVFNLSFPNYVGSKQELIAVVSSELATALRGGRVNELASAIQNIS